VNNNKALLETNSYIFIGHRMPEVHSGKKIGWSDSANTPPQAELLLCISEGMDTGEGSKLF